MKKLPKILKIGAHKIKLLTNMKNDRLAGEYDAHSSSIFVDSRLAPTQKLSTLMHEALHAMNSELNHGQLDSLAEQLTQFLVDNKFIKL